METSALFSVGRYLGLRTASILIASDRHPLSEDDAAWEWHITRGQRAELFEKSLAAVLKS